MWIETSIPSSFCCSVFKGHLHTQIPRAGLANSGSICTFFINLGTVTQMVDLLNKCNSFSRMEVIFRSLLCQVQLYLQYLWSATPYIFPWPVLVVQSSCWSWIPIELDRKLIYSLTTKQKYLCLQNVFICEADSILPLSFNRCMFLLLLHTFI